ncbi:HD domain-containing protein [Candidatus Dojkabacteria bacterium]|nr:HD domain-containing protein [Candidatus Dojkabacteria bacterium]
MNIKKIDQHIYEIELIIPEYVQTVARILSKEGFKCYLVGGALRDLVMGILPDDYDLATDALPDQMLNIFPKAVSTGAKFGTVTVIIREKDGYPTYQVEVTTFRSDEKYVDGRWPSTVEFVKNLDEDLKRRDFTWNSMAMDLASADLDGSKDLKKMTIYDPFDGIIDLNNKIVRSTGVAEQRFSEDGLRALRACRLAAELGFDIEEKTFKAITKTLAVSAQVSMERVRDEIVKLLNKSEKPSIGIEFMRKSGLLKLFIPELLEGVGFDQPIFHKEDVYKHLLSTMDLAPVNIRLAALLHDIGKPRKAMADGHFYGHDIEGEKITREVMQRLRFSRAEIDRVARLVKFHMFYYPIVSENASEKDIEIYESKKWTDSAVRRFIARVGEENIDDLFSLRIADASSNPDGIFQPAEIEQLQERISEIRQKDMALKINDLKIDGNDLAELGIEKGPLMGIILKDLLEKVIDDPSMNTKDQLLDLAKSMKK